MTLDLQQIYTSVNLDNPVNRNHPLNRGRVAWWLTLPQIAGGNKFHDLMGLSHGTLTNMGNTTSGWRSSSYPGMDGWLSFTKSQDSYVSIGNPASLQITGPMTIRATYLLSSAPTGAYQIIAKDKDSGGRAYTLDVHTTLGVRWYINGGGASNEVDENRVPIAGDMRDLHAVYTGSGMVLYINGVSAGSASGSSASIVSATANVLIGRREYSGNTDPMDGYIGDVSIWNRALSAVEVKADYDLSRSGYPGVLNRRQFGPFWPALVVNPAPILTAPSFNISYPVNLSDPVNRDHPLNRGRIAWWMGLPGIDGGNKLYDVGGLNHGTLTGMTTSGGGWSGTTRPGGFGNLLYDATDDYVNVASSSVFAVSNVTISAWIRRTATNVSYQMVLARSTAGNAYDYIVALSDTNLVAFLIGGVGGWYNSTTALTVNVWTHILVTYDASNVRIYVNGILETTTSAPGTISNNSGTVVIGRNQASANQYFAGSIDDVSVWSRALSAAEARSVYDLSRLGYPGVLNRISLVFSAFIATLYAQSLTATSSVSASIIKQINKGISTTSTGTAIVTKGQAKVLSATATGTTNLTKSVGKVLSAAVTGTSGLVKAIAKALSVIVVGTATKSVVNLLKHIVRVVKGGGSHGPTKGGGDDGVNKGGGIG